MFRKDASEEGRDFTLNLKDDGQYYDWDNTDVWGGTKLDMSAASTKQTDVERFTVGSAHGLAVGDYVRLINCKDSNGALLYNGTYQVKAIDANTTFDIDPKDNNWNQEFADSEHIKLAKTAAKTATFTSSTAPRRTGYIDIRFELE